ncbi:T9SS type A sorting domain-containing protein [Winogradskyella litoriviva]|uniref:T9SS type A sorting domain-containing protein n=1 Tax=Winogradskyella litoriviva TaxID=1220182 RepID=A0ABX2E4G2_9FLAO|nr:T9SS type A sorting domain-containing protein [Winogradskyella litoriviva]NRD23250.1 T9SS type A sorting domain-containing protein [Winogradskyella litoriviva]
MRNFYAFLLLILIGNFGFGQTTVIYDFSASGAVSGFNEPAPGIDLDSNIGFGSFRNSGTSNPGIFSNQLRLYQNATKGGSIVIYARNGVTITKVVVNASSRTGDAGYTVDSGTQTNLTGSSTYTIDGISGITEVEFFQKDSGSSNRIYVDSFEVTYTSTSSGPEDPSTFTAATFSSTQIDLAYAENAASDNVVIVFDTDNSFTTPSGIPATVGNAFAGGTVLLDSNGTGIYNHTGLAAGTTYYYMAYSYDSVADEYSAGLSADATTPIACPAISNLTIDSFTDSEVTVSWTGGNTEVDWEIVVQDNGLAAPTSGTATSTNPHTWSGLSELTAYDVYVRADCDTDGFSTWVGPVTFTTEPSCPTISNITIDSFTDSEVTVSWTNGDSEADWEIVVQDSGLAAPTSGTATSTNPHTWSGLSELTAYDVYVRADCDTDGFSTWVGPVTFTTEPSCPAISNITIDSFTDSEVTVSWTNGDSEADWEIVVQDNGLAAPTSGTATSTNPHTWSGLSAITAYDVYVRADCDTDGFSTWVGPVTFTTACAIYTPNYTQDFSSIIPECWDEADSGNQASGPSSLGSSLWTEDGYLNSGATGAYRINLFTTGKSDWLLSPQFDLTGGPFQVGFDIGILEWNSTDTAGTLGSDDIVQLLISNDNGSTWTALVTFDSSSVVPATGTTVAYNLSAYTGQTVQFGIYASEGSTDNDEDNDIFIDNFNVVEAKDADTGVNAATPQILGSTITAADATTVGTAFEVIGFEVQDQGTSDGLPTNITTMRFVPGANNTADWTDFIQGVTLKDGNLVTHTPTVSITDTEIELTFGTSISVTDNSALEFSLGIYLNTTNIVDGSVIQLQIDESGSLDANASGSDFIDPYTFGDVIGNDFIIDVDATELAYIVQPSTTFINTAMSPNVEIAYTDANGNIDVDYSGSGYDISVTTDGNFSGIATLTAEATDGIAVFDNLVFDTLATGIKLTATDDSPLITGAYDSDLFDIESIPVGPVIIVIQDFDSTTPEWTYTLTPSENSAACVSNNDVWNVVSSLGNVTVPNSTGDFFGGRDLNGATGCGTTGTGTIDFDSVDVSAYTNITLTFDYEIDGFNSFSDKLSYIATFDSVNESRVYLCQGCNDQDVEGTVSIDVPDGTNTVSLQILASFDGASDYFGVDNFKIEGTIPPTTYTYNGTWSPSDPDGVSLASEAIVIESGSTSLTTDTDINTVTINPGAGLTIDAGVTLTVTTDLTLESNSTSYASLISDGTISGTVIYKRHVNTFNNTSGSTNGQNDLISAPVTNASQDFGTFRGVNNNIPSGTVAGDVTTYYLFGPYDNNEATSPYTLFSDADDATVITAGTGYRTASTDTSTFTFTGDVLSGIVPVTITTGSDNAWNLIGNPYPSYINSSDFLNENFDSFDSEFIGIYGYDGDASNGWTVINLANATDITPGQGFMVLTDQASATVNFTPAMRRDSGSDDFIVGRSADINAHFSLKIENNNTAYTTDFYFNSNTTRGLDPGYDTAIFTAQLPDLYVYSHLVENNTGRAMAIQSLGSTDLTDVTIPLGVNANDSEQITFSIDESTLPNIVEVYLEDNVENTFTLLTAGDYTVTPNTNLTGTGRFYLRYTTTALSTSETSLDNLSIFNNTSEKTIVVSGQLLEDTKANLYDIQGRLVTKSLLNSSNRLQNIDVSNLSTGVYVIELINETQTKTQKVIIR